MVSVDHRITMDVDDSFEIAQFVILDVGIPNPAHISEAVLHSVSNVLCLSQAGHIPAVGLALINATYQPIIRLSSTQSPLKLKKILHAISSVKNTGKCRARISIEEFQDYIHLGIKTAIQDFETLPNYLTEGEVCPEKLQITIFSMKNLSETLNHMKTALPLSKIGNIFKILVVELVEDFLDSGCLRKEQCFSTFLEYLQVNGTVSRLDELMKQWLSCGDVQQHVKLVVQDLIILCDVRDCIIRPSPPSTCDSTSSQGSVEEAVGDEDVLEVIHRLPTEGVCETHMFGDPILLMPCQWQNHLKPEENEGLTLNKKYFSDLCSKLGMSDEYLIIKYEKKNQPVRFMLLMPGAGVLLAKELVSAEMAYPVSDDFKSLDSLITPEIDSNVTTALVTLPSIPSYDPNDFSSGLYTHLLRKIQRPTSVELKQAPLCRDPSHETLVVGIQVKKKTKLKRKSSHGRILSRYRASDIPQLTESDQQTLAQCFSKHREKFKLTEQ